ncbi:hypothetical protein SGPA1_41087 [Streptomyces misionensis JCM 4497]
MEHRGQCVGVVRRLVLAHVLRTGTARRPARARGGHDACAARRLLSLPRLVLQPLPSRRPFLEHTGLICREPRLPVRQRRLEDR